MNELKVFQVAPAPARAAAWLRELLRVPIAAARFESPPPVETRPTGVWGGWSAPRTSAPDGRVALSNHIVLWTPRGIVASYLHESAHAVIHGVEGAQPGHDAVFFSLLATLLLRVDAATDRAHNLVETLELYDIQDRPDILLDEPDEGVGSCLTWSLTLAHELAGTKLSAEALAREIVQRYGSWLVEISDRPRQLQVEAERAKRESSRQVVTLDQLKDKLFVSNMVAAISLAFLVLIAVMLWRR